MIMIVLFKDPISVRYLASKLSVSIILLAVVVSFLHLTRCVTRNKYVVLMITYYKLFPLI